ncbi:MAG: cobalamin-independent methionine synthase II family protein [Alphaproteobacteria bacterium]|nr:cobalamin-independent methionine synthase II family protein [Alphaproteobacteria bacterium]
MKGPYNMHRSEGRILTTHAGSLPRPPALVQMFADRVQGRTVDTAALAAAIEAATNWALPKQLEAGIDIPNNGEQPRDAFFLYVRHRMSGFTGLGTRRPPADVARYPGFQAMRDSLTANKVAVTNFNVPAVVDEVRYLDPAFVETECSDFRSILTAHAPGQEEAFITAPSPGIIAAAVPNEHYDSDESYLDALAEALRIEYEAIVAHGFTLQLDCPDLALERHITYADRPVAEFIQFVERVVAAINRSLAKIPRDAVRLHVCWGNYEGPHDLDVPLAEILPAILQADVGGIVLPFANPRHAHEYKIFANGPLADDQLLVAGVIDTTTNYVEHPETVADRIERIARALGDPSRVLAGTDCGFDTSAGMGKVAEDVVWAKLAALSEGAKLASERLFP